MNLLGSLACVVLALVMLGQGNAQEPEVQEYEGCKKKLDIALICDMSNSVKKKNVIKFKEFLKELVGYFDVSRDGTHFSVTKFFNKPKLLFDFNVKRWHNKDKLKKRIDAIPNKNLYGTRTDKAMKLVNEKVFTPNGGDRPEVPNSLIIFTDGKPTGQTKPDFTPLGDLSEKLRAKGVQIIAVGIGWNIKNKTLEEIAGNADDVMSQPSFETLNAAVQDVAKKICGVDGGWTEWSEWSECSVTCGGGGKRTHTRTCTNPPPSGRGEDCVGESVETAEDCGKESCETPGGYSEWNTWSECSVTCGEGVQSRSRTCTNPPPANGGKNCVELGPSSETQECATSACPIDGGLTEWTKWSDCSATCGGGVQSHSRTCTNPPPANGGKNCDDLGPTSETQECATSDCPPRCDAGLDIGLVIDKSLSVGMNNLIKLKEFLGMLVDEFNPSPVNDHFSLIEFAKKASLELTFADDQYHPKEALLQRIRDIPEKLTFGTRTDLALQLVNDEMFTVSNGKRVDKPSLLLVFTDGKPTFLNDDEFKEFAKGITKEIQAKGIYTVAIGIGKGVKQEVLRQIAAGGDILSMKSFDELKEKIPEIKNAACV